MSRSARAAVAVAMQWFDSPMAQYNIMLYVCMFVYMYVCMFVCIL